MKLIWRVSGFLALLLLLASCNLFAPSSGTIGLNVHGPSEFTSLSCSSGIQATLTILSDQTKFTSPIVTNDELKQESSTQTYNVDTRVKVEAYCYENNNVIGKLIVEGKIRPPLIAASSRKVSISPAKSKEDLIKYCISNQLSESNKKRDMNILKYLEPVPCITITDFSF